MKVIRTLLDASFFSNCRLPDDTILFDIETTGLSADTSYLYLIGAIHQTEEGPAMTQWFCDNFSEEKELLVLWKQFLAPCKTLIHFNGCGFDVPYLNKKFARHKLRFQIEPSETMDIYKLLLPYRRLFSLSDMKQKTLEVHCDFTRADTFDGSDLISVYAAYTGKARLAELTGNSDEADALRTVLLLHNHDDLLGLLALFLRTRLLQIPPDKLHPKVSHTGDCLRFTFQEPVFPFCGSYPIGLPKKSGSRKDNTRKPSEGIGTLMVFSDKTEISIKLFSGELKYFFENYRDYTYLVYEDTAIHNSLAAYVDKSARQKCRPSTAYQKKKSLFLPLPFSKLPESFHSCYLFYSEYKTAPAFLDFADFSASGGKSYEAYITALFSSLPKLLP